MVRKPSKSKAQHRGNGCVQDGEIRAGSIVYAGRTVSSASSKSSESLDGEFTDSVLTPIAVVEIVRSNGPHRRRQFQAPTVMQFMFAGLSGVSNQVINAKQKY